MTDAPKEWIEPQEAFLTRCPDCEEKLVPAHVVMDVNTDNYTGPFAVLIYCDTDDVPKIAINGRVFTRYQMAQMHEYAESLLTEVYVDRILKDAFLILDQKRHR